MSGRRLLGRDDSWMADLTGGDGTPAKALSSFKSMEALNEGTSRAIVCFNIHMFLVVYLQSTHVERRSQITLGRILIPNHIYGIKSLAERRISAGLTIT